MGIVYFTKQIQTQKLNLVLTQRLNFTMHCSIYDENKIMNCLIVIDDVLGLADSCKEFAGFLTITENIDIIAFMFSIL